MTSDDRARAQWQGMVAQLRDRVYGYVESELYVLQWLIEERLRELRGDPQPIRPIDTKGLTGHLLQSALSINETGMRLYRLGSPGAASFAAIATPADKAKADQKFQKLIQFVTGPKPLAFPPPPKDTKP